MVENGRAWWAVLLVVENACKWWFALLMVENVGGCFA